MVRSRPRTDVQTEKQIEAFAAQAEQPAPPLIKAVPDVQAAVELREVAGPGVATDEAISMNVAPKKAAPSPMLNSPLLVDWKRRNREPKTGGINFRASASQLDLLRQAALMEEISQQKVLERLVWPILEERYGTGSAE
ncbi:hypothetical protein KIH31_15440 [Paenarthrobacter sp. DKR-5]|uniref:hypothetical protein n=1 Tax=Paenarthrobacter sp. DKR-5 TaxID=2835535 RepID=UPI001BDD3325|nr:hypothetical protein [Paenarthrobacter sp. DKR-5]MBT1003982.1 hypothetical protein [Paenarthrobacter sp. DKR-5]